MVPFWCRFGAVFWWLVKSVLRTNSAHRRGSGAAAVPSEAGPQTRTLLYRTNYVGTGVCGVGSGVAGGVGGAASGRQPSPSTPQSSRLHLTHGRRTEAAGATRLVGARTRRLATVPPRTLLSVWTCLPLRLWWRDGRLTRSLGLLCASVHARCSLPPGGNGPAPATHLVTGR